VLACLVDFVEVAQSFVVVLLEDVPVPVPVQVQVPVGGGDLSKCASP